MQDQEEQNRFSSVFTKKAEKYYRKIPIKIYKQIDKHIDSLELKPTLGWRLHDKYAGYWALDSGEFRIIYDIDYAKKQLIIIKIGPRGDVYKK